MNIDAATIFKIALTCLYCAGLTIILDIEKPRKVVTKETALVTVIVNILLIWGIWALL
jgi:hypothetical protein